jgi:hypothetical protein
MHRTRFSGAQISSEMTRQRARDNHCAPLEVLHLKGLQVLGQEGAEPFDVLAQLSHELMFIRSSPEKLLAFSLDFAQGFQEPAQEVFALSGHDFSTPGFSTLPLSEIANARRLGTAASIASRTDS